MLPDLPRLQIVQRFLWEHLCVIFLIDFAMHMLTAPRKRDYFIGERGYPDRLGSIPSFGAGIFQFAALVLLFRLSRLFRLRKILNPENRALLKKEILKNRSRLVESPVKEVNDD